MFSNIVVAIKESAPPEPLVDLALKAAAPGAQIHLVTLVRANTDEDRNDELSRVRKVEERLDGVAESLRGRGYRASREAGVIVVAAAVDLHKIASHREADLMVIGLARRSRVGKALMGSDAQRILLSAECPVLALRLE